MTTTIDTTARNANAHAPLWLRVLNWLADRDAAYRSAQKLRSMPEERLVDMGITRQQADLGSFRRASRNANGYVPTRLAAPQNG